MSKNKNAVLTISDDFQHLATIDHIRIPKRYRYMIYILSRAITYISIFLYSVVLYISQGLENDIF